MITSQLKNHKSEFLQSSKLNLLKIYARISNNIPIPTNTIQQTINGYIELQSDNNIIGIGVYCRMFPIVILPFHKSFQIYRICKGKTLRLQLP